MWGGCTLYGFWSKELSHIAKTPHNADSNDRAIVVWFDNLSDQTKYYRSVVPDQIVNRLPMTNLLCRKASFIRLIERMQRDFRQEYSFIPESFILPISTEDFKLAFKKVPECKYILKPDNGSLGWGIQIVKSLDEFQPSNDLRIAQRYIEPKLYDNRKFDLRIYVLIAADPKGQ
jgi:hypothetical protein